MRHVFISYSRHDTTFVEKLDRDLRAQGIDTWRDTSSIIGGEEWYKAIVQGIHAAYAMIQVVTPHSDQSRWVLREGLYADQKGLPIIPLLPARHQIPFHLIATQPITCEDYAAGLNQLVAALNALRVNAASITTALSLGPTDRATELAYLDFVLSEMKAELRSARYVNLGATRERQVFRQQTQPTQADDLGEFQLSFDRFEPLVKAERIHGAELDRPDRVDDDARVPLREMERAILLGDPGSGKSTTLQQLTIDLARDAQQAPAALLPVFVPLRSYDGQQPFADFVRSQLGPLQSQYDRLLAAGRLTLLCDALNEMPRHANGRSLIDAVRDYLRDRRNWVVSCRVRDYQEELRDLPDVGKVRLRPLDLPRIKDVIDRRFSTEPEQATALWQALRGSDALLDAWREFEGAGETETFWSGVSSGERFRMIYTARDAWRNMLADPSKMMPLCRNPFILFMVCGTFEQMGELPTNRGALFASFVDNLLRREEEAAHATGRAWIDTAIIHQALAHLAYAMQQSETGTEITREAAVRILDDLPAVNDPDLLLRLATSASLLTVGERVRYGHQLLQEYFASGMLAAAMEAGQPAIEFWPPEAWWQPQGWEETAIILAGAYRDPAQAVEWVEQVVRWITPAQPEIAYQALTECGVDLDPTTLETLRQTIIENVDAKKIVSDPIERAAAYRVLGIMDADDRPGIGLRADGLPDIDWVEIPAGEFIYQVGQRRKLPTFYISRYPITYKQFQAFLDAPDGFNKKRWWRGMPRAYRQQPMNEQYFRYSNRPRETVSWYHAVAFCRWLSDKLGYDIRLPKETEWEKAARGTDGREYPYGDEFDESKGNVTRIAQTSAVGIFPAGVSPYGVLDMSGNVWEWCQNKYRRFDLDRNAWRVLRGGAWSYFWFNARCVSRFDSRPTFRSSSFGFRVVCGRPPSL